MKTLLAGIALLALVLTAADAPSKVTYVGGLYQELVLIR